MSRNTGRYIVTKLKEIDAITGTPTGRTKPNLPEDPDYIAPYENLTVCPITPTTTTTTSTTTTTTSTTTTTTSTTTTTTSTTTTTTTRKPVENLSVAMNWASITDKNFNEVERPSSGRIRIVQHDSENKRFKCDLSDLAPLSVRGTGGEEWVVSQGAEASSWAEVLRVEDGWIYYGKTYLGSMNFSVGAIIEFFNPFVNYSICNQQRPTLAIESRNDNNFPGIPTTLGGSRYDYLVNGGLIEKEDGVFRVFVSAVVKRGNGRTFVAEDTNIEGSFRLLDSDQPFLTENDIHSSNPYKTLGECMVWCVDKTNSGYIALLASKDGNNVQYPGFVMLNNDGEKRGGIRCAELILSLWRRLGLSNRPPQLYSCLKFKEKWHLTVINWGDKLSRVSYHVILKDNVRTDEELINALLSSDIDTYIESYKLIHRGSDYREPDIRWGAVQFRLFVYKEKLYAFYFSESFDNSLYMNSHNREAGMALYDERTNSWNWGKGLQFINPTQMFRKYPNLYWCFDHGANNANVLIHKGSIYFGSGFATDNPDYFGCILKFNFKLS